MDTITLKMVFYSLFYPHIQYCISAWDGAADSYLKPIVCLQKRIIRYVGCVPAKTTTKPLFKNTDVLKSNDMLAANL